MESRKYSSGLTIGSIPAIFLGVFLMAGLIQFFDIVIMTAFSSEHVLTLPAMWVFLTILLICGIFYAITRMKLLSRAELLCVLFSMLLSAPLMTQGFWHRIVAVTATNPRGADWDKMDATNDRLWPHGPNLLTGRMTEGATDGPKLSGAAKWDQTDIELGQKDKVVVLENKANGEESSIRFKMPLEAEGVTGIAPNRPYLVSVLVRANNLSPDSQYFCRFYSDDNKEFSEAFTGADKSKITFLHKTGFGRAGAYGVKFSPQTKDHVWIEFGLKGAGRVELHDPKLFSVEALELIYKGRKVVTESQLEQVPPTERSGLLVKPDNMWSVAGVKFILAGYIPLSDWATPFFAWTSFITLVLLGCLMINVIMRKQWLENERFLMPLTRVPVALLGGDGEEGAKPVWKSGWMWAGFVISLTWALLKAAHFYNPAVPNTEIIFRLHDYLSDPGWGQMFATPRFEVNGIFLSLAAFMELNVLISIVIGYWFFRGQMFVGYQTRTDILPGFPWTEHQQTGAYFAYALSAVLLSWRYLLRVFKATIGAEGGEKSDGNIISYRAAVTLLILSFAGIGLWSGWLGMGIGGMMIFFFILLTVGMVTAKIRTECGTPWGYFTPSSFIPIMMMLGSVQVFGAETMILCYLASFCLAPTVFFLIPGAQLEFMELGRRMNVNPRHILITCIGAVVLGMFLGGWVFLSNAYALGGEKLPYGWAFDTKLWYFFSYNTQMIDATNHYLESSGQATAAASDANSGIPISTWAFFFTGAITMALSFLRQMFAGFWFHPAGLLLGTTNFSDYVWGSCLTAWAIRGSVLWLGGAATVRNWLVPFFVGFFLGTILAELLIGIHAAHLRAIGINLVYSSLNP